MKILLVDDEKLLLDSLEASINWKSYGLEVVGKACNGLQALELCEKNLPDLVITDVKMGQMDGIRLAKELNYRYPEIKIILLSAYDDFKYAQQAIELNVSKYILKLEAGKEALLQSILELKNADQNQENAVVKAVQNVFSNSEKSLLKIIHGTAAEKEWEWWSSLSIEKQWKQNAVYAIRPDLGIGDHAEELRGILSKLNNLFADGIGVVSKDLVYYVTSIQAADSDTVRRQAIRIKSIISISFGDCSIGVTYAVKPREIEKGIKQAESALEWSFYTGRGSLNFFQEKEERTITPIPYHKFITDLRCSNYQRIKKNLFQIYEECEKGFCYEKRQLLALTEYIFLTIDDSSQEAKVHEWISNAVENLGQIAFLIDLKRLTDSGLDLLMKQKQEWTAESKIVQASIDFIMVNYESAFSLNEISEHVFVSSSYLSKLFKKEMGMTLTSFIQLIKIKYAKEALISEPQKSVTEISSQLGFESSSYFSYVFERLEGMTPSEFRKKQRNQHLET